MTAAASDLPRIDLSDLASALALRHGGDAVVVLLRTADDGSEVIDSATPDDPGVMEVAAAALLRLAANELAAQPHLCPACQERFERITAAIAVLDIAGLFEPQAAGADGSVH